MFRSLLVLVFAPLALAAPVPKSVYKRPNLDGRWLTTERVEWGKVDDHTRLLWEIDGEKVSPFNVYPDADPSPAYSTARLTITQPGADEIDLVYTDTNTRFVYRGKLKWDGDDLLVTLANHNQPRPAEVTATGVHEYYRFKRMPAR